MSPIRSVASLAGLLVIVPIWAQAQRTPQAPQGALVEIQDDPWILPDLPGSTGEALSRQSAFSKRIRRDLPRIEDELRALGAVIEPVPSKIGFPMDLKPQIDALIDIVKDPKATAMDDLILGLWQTFQIMDHLVGLTDTFLSLQQWQTLAAKGDPQLLEQLRMRNQHALRDMETAAIPEGSNAGLNHSDILQRPDPGSFSPSSGMARDIGLSGARNPTNLTTPGERVSWLRRMQAEGRAIETMEGRRTTEGREGYLYNVLFVRNFNARADASDRRRQADGIEAASDARLVADHFAPLLKDAWSPLASHWQKRARQLADLQQDPNLKGNAEIGQLLLRAQKALLTRFRFHLWYSGIISARLASAEKPEPLKPIENLTSHATSK